MTAHPSTRPTEVSLGAFLMIAALSVAVIRPPEWPGLLAALLAGAAASLAAARWSPPPRSRVLWCARALIPLLLFPLLYKMTGWINVGLPRWILDGPLERLEGEIFGGQPSLYLAGRAPWVPLSEALHACYLSYFLLLPCPPVALMIRGRDAEAERSVFALCGCLFLLLLFYIWLPVTSPLYKYPMIDGASARGFFFRLAHDVSGEGGVVGGAFPSAHAALSTLALIISWRWLRPIFWVTLAPTIGLLIATVYCRYHYALDTLIGVAVGWLVYLALVAPSGQGREKRSSRGDPLRSEGSA